jgi:hypothetical protein
MHAFFFVNQGFILRSMLSHCRQPPFLPRHPEIDLAAVLPDAGHNFFIISSPCGLQ